MPRIPNSRLKKISEADCKSILLWKEGVSLASIPGKTIPTLLLGASADRWRLAVTFKAQADKLLRSRPPQFRSAISRCYYCMYHAFRACAFIFHEGDDHQKHSELPLHLPKDFPVVPPHDWSNILKMARLDRNKVDYEPYPKADTAWAKRADTISLETKLVLSETKKYLRSKGCSL